MIKVIMCTTDDYSEIDFYPQDIEIKNGKYFVNGTEYLLTASGAEILQIYYAGAQAAFDKKISKKQAAEALATIKL